MVSELGLLLESADFRLNSSDHRTEVEEKWQKSRLLVISGVLVLINHF